MIKVHFKDLEPSEIAKEAAIERIEEIVSQFPDLAKSQIHITLSMQNSPTQAGPDEFSVKFRTTGGRYRGIIVEKGAESLYKALALLIENLLERLNRFGDKARVKQIKSGRKLKKARFEADIDPSNPAN